MRGAAAGTAAAALFDELSAMPTSYAKTATNEPAALPPAVSPSRSAEQQQQQLEGKGDGADGNQLMVGSFKILLMTLITNLIVAPPNLLAPLLTEEKGWSLTVVTVCGTIGSVSSMMIGPAVGFLSDRGYVRVMITAGGFLGGVSMLLTWQSNTVLVFALASIARSFCWSLTSSIVLFRALLPAEHSKHAGAKSDAAMGITLLDTAASSALTLPILAYAVETLGLQTAALYLGSVGVVLLPICWLLLVNNLLQRANELAAAKAASEGDDAAAPAKMEPASYRTFLAPMKTPAFHALCGMFFVCGITSSGVAETHLLYWAKDQGMSTVEAASLASTKTFVNSCSLFLASIHTMWGHDPSKPLAVIYFMRGVSYVLATYAHTPLSMYLWAINFGFFDYATQPYTVALLRMRCGADALSFLFSVLGFVHAIGHNIGSLGAARVRDATGSFERAFLGCALSLVVASSLALLTPGKAPPAKGGGLANGQSSSSLSWQKLEERPAYGEEITSGLLSDSLASGKTIFTRAEIDEMLDLGGRPLQMNQYIAVGSCFFKPTEMPNLLL